MAALGVGMQLPAHIVVVLLALLVVSPRIAAEGHSTDDADVDAQTALYEDCEILRQLYAETGGPTLWKVKWDFEGLQDCCLLYGVTCTNDAPRVTQLALDSNGLNGTLPESIMQLSELTNLSMSYNFMVGLLPSNVSNATSLEFLNLAANAFAGELPSTWAMLPQLKSVMLSWNELEGTLPSTWAEASSLEVVALQGNRFSGTLPTSWGRMQNLRELFIMYNHFEGVLPTEWAQMDSLESIAVDGNELTGSLPSQLSQLKMLSSIFAVDNQLSGTLPTEWGGMLSLELLFLEGNAFVGSLPTEWAALKNLQQLGLELNELTGSLPSEWREMSSLQRFSAGSNKLSGDLPSSWSALSRLESVFLASNNISSSLPPNWVDLSSLTILILSANNISGSLPAAWSRMAALSEVGLSQNHISGILPPLWSQMANLTAIDVSNNDIVGTIPREWEGMPVAFFYVGHNKLEGTLPAGIPLHVNQLDFTYNRFTKFTSAVFDLSVSKLDFTGNPLYLSELPEPPLSSSVTELDFSGTNMTLNTQAFPLLSGSLQKLNLSSNPGVSGPVESMPLAVSTVIEYSVSKCSISGFLNLMYIPPSSVLNLLDLSYNDGISGSIPDLSRLTDFTLDVTGIPLLHGNVSKLSFFDRMGFYGDTSYACPEVMWAPYGSRVFVRGLNASYFDYEGCRCSPGFYGTPPQCFEIQSTSETTIEVIVGVLMVVIALLGSMLLRPRIRAWWILRREMRDAHALLQHYAGSLGGPMDLNALLDRSSKMPAHWQILFRDLHIVRVIASGASGSISLGIWNHSYVAVKQFHTEGDMETCLSESQLHSRLHHPNVIQLLGVVMDPLCLVTEWMDRGSLYDLLVHDPSSIPPPRRVALDVARGMAYLHSCGILHRDLKSPNILLNSDGNVKVADFGHSRSKTEKTMTVGCGTASWTAPEVFQGGHYDMPCDVYSYGIVLYELVTGLMPFDGVTFSYQIQDKVCNGERPVLESDLSQYDPILLEMMKRCWDQRPQNRPTFEEIVNELQLCQDDETWVPMASLGKRTYSQTF